MTVDAVLTVAELNEYDPIAVYLHNLSHVQPLPDKDWFNLDQFLFNIDDPVARAFMPRYLVAAVKRACQPSSQYRQIPVLIGSQDIGKTELGRSLFGKYYGGGLSGKFDIDDVCILERLWCCELAELDGVTRKAQVESFKTFISRTEDFTRRKYGKGIIKIPRRSVFWGTSNTPPLNDSSGSTRFVGYIHQVRKWNVALKDEDLKQHTRNFESISFQSSTGTDIVNSVDNRAYYGSLSAHYKLKENMILTGDFNFIVDSTTASNTAVPVGFEAIPDKKRYRVFQNMKKINRFFPVNS